LSLEEVEEVVTRYAGHEKDKEIGEVVREIREIKQRGENREAVIRQMDLPQRLEKILTGSIGVIAARNVLRDMLPYRLRTREPWSSRTARWRRTWRPRAKR
jgi:hypothetical protein